MSTDSGDSAGQRLAVADIQGVVAVCDAALPLSNGDEHPFERLPRTVLAHVLEALVAAATPGNVVSLALTCRSLLAACAGADGLWLRQCTALGWRPPGGVAPFEAYTGRMRARVAVRRGVAAVAAFLPRRAAAALNRGAPPQALAAAEARLGVPLPWELWELLRHRDGQAPGPGVYLVDDARLLAACELFLELRELPALRLTPEAAGAAAQRECVGVGGLAGGGPAGGWERAPRTRADCLGPGSAQPAAGTALGGAEGSGDQDGTPLVRSSGTTREADPSGSGRGTGAGARVPLVVFATNSGGSRLYGVCAGGDGGGGGRGGGGEGGGEVFVLRGLMTTRRVAGSVSGFLARLVA